jgi:Ca2+-transporting ATPase
VASPTTRWPPRRCACSGSPTASCPSSYEDADLTRDLTFVGLVGMIDPLRDEAKATIATCREPGSAPS